MKRWTKKVGAALMLLAGLAGCKQQLYMTVGDHQAVTATGLPKDLANDPNVVATPTGDFHPKPTTVDFPDRPPRYMTLAECIAIAMESGTRGSTAVNLGIPNVGGGRSASVYLDDLTSFTGNGIAGDDAIRAFALDPAITATNIEGALSKFDARLLSTMTWQKNDTASANVFNNLQNGDSANFNSGIYKPLPTGGLAGITFTTNYSKLSNPPSGFSVVNPSYQPALQFNFEQPLLRDYGIEINQLLPSHPGTTQIGGLTSSGGRSEGILITRIRADEQRTDFERTVNIQLFNVENVYWALYASYFELYAAEQGLRQAYVTWQLTQSELEAGKKTAHEVAQVRAQFASFRGQRVAALQTVLNNERQMRGILGLPVEDGKRIVPADAPTLAPYSPDYNSALTEALASRPELILARQEVRVQQLNVRLQENGARPDLRVFANYNINSIGTQLDGSEPNNALAKLSDNKFNTWAIGLRLTAPFGFRDAHASIRAAELNLARSMVVLKNQERKADLFLTGVYQQIFNYYRQIEAARERRIAVADQLRGLYARIQAGRDPLITILQAQTDFATALQQEYDAIANYNIAIAGFQYAKGTIMAYNNVVIADGPLPHCTLTRAREHERQRSEGIVARERATIPTGDGPHPLPTLLEHQPPTPELPPESKAPERMPLMDPRPTGPAAADPGQVILEKPTAAAPGVLPPATLGPTGRPLPHLPSPVIRTPAFPQ
jgi:outer membrane protein TolC